MNEKYTRSQAGGTPAGGSTSQTGGETPRPEAPAGTPQVSPYVPVKEPKTPVRFAPRDWLFLLAAVVLAWLCMETYSAVGFVTDGPAGLGVPVFTAALLGAVFLRLGKKARVNAYSLYLTGCTFLLALSCFLCGNPWLFFLNSFAALGVGAMAVFSLSGQLRSPRAGAASLGEGFCLFFQAIFVHMGKPFQALAGLKRSDRKLCTGVLIGLLCAIPVLAVVIALLSSADAVFGAMFRSLGDWFQSTDLLYWLWRAVRILFVALLFFSGLYFLTVPRKPPAPPAQPSAGLPDVRPAAPFVTALGLLCGVYVLFCGIQAVYLFGGAETAAMEGGYAAYARSGFFQLAAVAAINVCAVLSAVTWGSRCAPRARKALGALSLVLIALTLVILSSAVYRMGLYISVYGLSLLRLMTLWGMLVVLVCLGAAVWKVLRPGFRFFPVFFLFALTSWVLLSAANPNALIARYNVDAYLSGAVEQVDVDYLARGLSFDGCCGEALPALEKLAASGAYEGPINLEQTILEIREGLEKDRGWVYWHLWELQER